MRRTTASLVTALSAAALGLPAHAAEVPPHLVHQGVLTERESGRPVEGTLPMVFSIYAAPAGGEPLWRETLEVAVAGGHFSVTLGRAVPLPPGLWEAGPRFLGVRVGGDSEMSPRDEIGSVPYAQVAANVTGAITPRKISIAGKTVIDEQGAWVGPAPDHLAPLVFSATLDKPRSYSFPLDGQRPDWRGQTGNLAKFTFTSPRAGVALVTAHMTIQARNFYDQADPNQRFDCHVATALGAGVFRPDHEIAEPGGARLIVSGALPTQLGAGGYQSFAQTNSRALPVLEGKNVVYLNLSTSCLHTIVRPITVTAILLGAHGEATLDEN